MRKTILSSVVSVALFGGVFQSSALSAAQPAADRESNIVVTAGQGGSFTISVPAATNVIVAGKPDRPIEVTAGNGGAVPVLVPSSETVATPQQALASISGE